MTSILLGVSPTLRYDIWIVGLILSLLGGIFSLTFLILLFKRAVRHSVSPHVILVSGMVFSGLILSSVVAVDMTLSLISNDISSGMCDFVSYLFSFVMILQGSVSLISTLTTLFQLYGRTQGLTFKWAWIIIMISYFFAMIWTGACFSSIQFSGIFCFVDFFDQVNSTGITSFSLIFSLTQIGFLSWIYVLSKAILLTVDESDTVKEIGDKKDTHEGGSTVNVHADSRVNVQIELPGQIENKTETKQRIKDVAVTGPKATKRPLYLRNLQTLRWRVRIHILRYSVQVFIIWFLQLYGKAAPIELGIIMFIILLIPSILMPIIYAYTLSILKCRRGRMPYLSSLKHRGSHSHSQSQASSDSDNQNEAVNVTEASLGDAGEEVKYQYNGIKLKNDPETHVLIIDESSLVISRILMYEEGADFIIKFIRKEKLFCEEQIYFLLEIREFRKLAMNIEDLRPAWDKENSIINTYLQEGERMVANIGGRTREEIIKRFEKQNKDKTVEGNEFHDAFKEVNSMFNDFTPPNGFLYKFIQSSYFYYFSRYIIGMVKKFLMTDQDVVREVLKEALLI